MNKLFSEAKKRILLHVDSNGPTLGDVAPLPKGLPDVHDL